MKRVLTLSLLAGLAANPAAANDGVASKGRLSDNDFYRLASCGASPKADCLGPEVRWPTGSVTLALRAPHRHFPANIATQVSAEIDRAIAEINGAGAGITVHRDDRLKNADILVSLPVLSEGDPTHNIPRIPDGNLIGVGFMWLWWNERAEITEASMLISQDIAPEDVASVVLEELFQCLGFLYDIENPYYEGRSILSQDSNATTRITGQDRMALRRLYPKS